MEEMKILKLSARNHTKVVAQAVAALKKGKVLACPTDTIYGLIADAHNARAVQKIFKIKKRTSDKPLGIFVKDLAMAKKYAAISESQRAFLRKSWPGKVTAVLKRKGNFLQGLGTKETIGVRVPKHRFLQQVMSLLGGPLAQTSVNISGQPPLQTAPEIISAFPKNKHQPDLVIDGGVLDSFPSTVVDLTGKVKKVLRK
ncbi:MAG: threonylcarbamoyl-AMP synthase [Candidatus Wildermuthbacteria bacterium]|nr:threonylcarbamoyl-AMP synthase [Candidatus Wildermuthbacteria bacterium]